MADVGAMAGLWTIIQGVGIGHLWPAWPNAANEIVPTDNFRCGEAARFDGGWVISGVICGIARATQSGMIVIDAGVQDCYANTSTVDTGILNRGGANVGYCFR